MKYFIMFLLLAGGYVFFQKYVDKKGDVSLGNVTIKKTEVRKKLPGGGYKVLSEDDLVDEIKVKTLPKITQMKTPKKQKYKDFTLTAIKKGEVHGRIFHTRPVPQQMGSLLDKVIYLGWGKMSNPRFISNFSFSEGSMSYCSKVESDYDFTKDYFDLHIIPSKSILASDLADVKTADIVKLSGYFVNVQKNKRDLLSSEGGKAEFFYLTKIQKNDRIIAER